MTPSEAQVVKDMERSACISECGRYRYWLTREWDAARAHVCFVMLNPSRADATVDDPTIRKCILYAKNWDYGGLHVVNLFALRATDPRQLRKQPCGGQSVNNTWIEHIVANSLTVICAWGVGGDYLDRDKVVMSLLDRVKANVYCLGVTKDGHPKHPLYLRGDVKPIPFKVSP